MVQLELAVYKPIIKWTPQISDVVFFYGWFNRWIGVINGIKGNEVTVIRAGSPIELFSYNDLKMAKNTVVLDVNYIQRSSSKYSIQRVEQNVSVWYI